MSLGPPLNIHHRPELHNPLLVVGWTEDAGNLGRRVCDYLNRSLQTKEFAEVDPEDFFSLGGVGIKDNLARFPESKFFASREGRIVVFRSSPPTAEWHRFLTSTLDVAQHLCGITEICTIGGIVTMSAHTTPRELVAMANLAAMKRELHHYGLDNEMDYETQPGQRPTLNSYLLWVARQRDIPASGLWTTIPLYLMGTDDPQADRKVLEFLDRRLHLGLDFRELDQEIHARNDALAQARMRVPEIDELIHKLESNLRLSEEENARLIERVESSLRRHD